MRYNITSRVEFIIILYEWRNAAFAGLVTVHGGACSNGVSQKVSVYQH
jgi:hypothetical protein